jgi:hypothetical protein
MRPLPQAARSILVRVLERLPRYDAQAVHRQATAAQRSGQSAHAIDSTSRRHVRRPPSALLIQPNPLDKDHRDAPGATTTGGARCVWDTLIPQIKSRGWPNGRGDHLD